ETCVTLWSKFEEFEFGTSFRKWSMAVAYNCARGYWRDKGRNRGWALTDQVLNKVGHIYEASVEIREIRQRLLDECLQQVSSSDREIVRQVYHDEVPPAEIAAERRVSVNAIYSRLTRLRQNLARCVKRKMS
ncbi:MAG: sigma-70 family RNA polymerase sigma factor, partial [Planctomycetota bacterium]